MKPKIHLSSVYNRTIWKNSLCDAWEPVYEEIDLAVHLSEISGLTNGPECRRELSTFVVRNKN